MKRHMEIVFDKLKHELSRIDSGTLFIHIRDNKIGKFGIRQEPMPLSEAETVQEPTGLTEFQQRVFRNLAIEALRMKHWSYGMIQFEFAVRKGRLDMEVQMESNYNMSTYQDFLN